ncbi:hypothetical protein TrRE_jg11318, partial [Triparma retinervis]
MIVLCVVVVGDERHWWLLRAVEAKCVRFKVGRTPQGTQSIFHGEGYEELFKLLKRPNLGGYDPIRISDIEISSPSNVTEHKLSYLIIQNIPGNYAAPLIQNTPTDYIAEYRWAWHPQLKLQLKSGSLQNKSGLFCANLYHKVDGVRAPYRENDNDFYIFGGVTGSAVYLWRIPESALLEHECIGEGATTSLHLHVPMDHEGEVKPLTRKKTKNAWTMNYFVGRFAITDAQQEALDTGDYLKELIRGNA